MSNLTKFIYKSTDGKIGINNTSPETQLDVGGGIRVGYSTDEQTGVLRWDSTALQVYTTTGWQTLGQAQSGGIMGNLAQGYLSAVASTSFDTSATLSQFYLQLYQATEDF